jgi:hypothetical protein
MLSVISPSVASQLAKTGLIRKIAWENSYPETNQIGQSGMEAWELVPLIALYYNARVGRQR